MIASRRQILQSTLALPFVSATAPRVSILTEDHCLSEESARGFQKIGIQHPNTIVAAAAGNLSGEGARELKRRVARGALLLFESAPAYSLRQADLLASEFQFFVSPAVDLSNAGWHGDYVQYCRPVKQFVRPFLAAVPVDATDAQVVAEVNGMTVAIERPFGQGKIIFLGSLLGPNLLAEDREAHDVAAALLRPGLTNIHSPAFLIQR